MAQRHIDPHPPTDHVGLIRLRGCVAGYQSRRRVRGLTGASNWYALSEPVLPTWQLVLGIPTESSRFAARHRPAWEKRPKRISRRLRHLSRRNRRQRSDTSAAWRRLAASGCCC
jgi:hypothetical protein